MGILLAHLRHISGRPQILVFFDIDKMFFPDNPDRAQRLQNLSNDISFIQQNIVQIRDNLQKQNADALAVLEQIATASGHQDLDAMIESAKGLMTPDQKKAMDDLAQKVRDRDANLDTAYKVAGGVAAIGTIIKFGREYR